MSGYKEEKRNPEEQEGGGLQECFRWATSAEEIWKRSAQAKPLDLEEVERLFKKAMECYENSSLRRSRWG